MSDLKVPELHPSKFEHPLVQAVRGEIAVVRPLTTYWVETVRSVRERELYAFLGEVAQAIEDLRKEHSARIDVTHVASDDFIETLASVTEVSIREHDEVKRSYLRRFLVNYSTHERPDITLRKVFFQFISDLSGLHLVVLDKVFMSQRSLGDEDLRVLAEQLDRSEALSIRALEQDLGVDQDLVAVLAATLESRGLMRIETPSAAVQDSTSRLIMRPLARRFMAFLHENQE